ncbi:MAG: long-chain fatty acid--CoA ligase [Planctomycetota bacterium]|nr:MAG: long-chain fatty acid--CoA ligase [Planctomycetota bacterium]
MEERIWHRFYDPGVPPSLEYEDLTIRDLLARSARRYAERPAVIFLNCRLSYAQLEDQVRRCAAALAALGVGKGSRVAVHAPNVPQTVIAFFAIQYLGAHAVMTNPLYAEPEIEHQWNDAGVEVAITMDFLWDRLLRGMRAKLPVKHYVIASIPEYLRFPLRQLAPLKLKKMDPPAWAKVRAEPGLHFFRPLVSGSEPRVPEVAIDMDDVALLQYTGGTTGVSKGAMLTQRNISCNVQQITAWFTGLEPGREVLLASLPAFHIFGLTVCTTWPVANGAAMVLMANPRDIPLMVKNISKHRVTLLPSVPALFNAVNQYPGIDKIDISSVKYCFSGSAPLPEDVQTRFEALTGSKIVEGFGLTETSPVVTVNPLDGRRKIGHIGIPIPDTDVKVVDPEDGLEEMPTGQEGELIVKGPQVMKGYWNMPDETAHMIRNGWLYTGDLAVMDEDGYLRIVGRKKDMILAGGYNIFPDEIDRVLMSHPDVVEACTIGVPDEKRGETVKSFIQLRPGAVVTEAELTEYCRERLARYKVPKLWEFREELPKSSMMKLLRRVLRDEEIRKRGDAGA